MQATPAHSNTPPSVASGVFHSLNGNKYASRAARRIITRTLGPDCPLLGDAVLVVSELVTNAVRHTWSSRPNGLVGLMIEMPDNGVVRVEVIDNGPLPENPTRPAVRPPDCLRDFGFGLVLVDSLAEDWGVICHERNGYRAVWTLLSANRGNDAA